MNNVHFVFFYRNVDVVKLLLRAGADTNIKNNKDWTVFDLATLAGVPQITRLLAPGGMKLNRAKSTNYDFRDTTV